MIELNTGICTDVTGVRRDLSRALAQLAAAAAPLGVDLVVSGTHPFARYDERLMYPAPRYRHLLEHRQWFARRLTIFGLHVHVGMRDGDHAIAMMNAILPYLPYVLALSASSPFWHGDDTGLASARSAVFESVPNAGMPPPISDWAEFSDLHDRLMASRSITSLKDLWWDIRPSPGFGTLEIRICDGLPTLGETLACVALVQSLLAWLDEQYRDGRRFPPTPLWLLRENKWRAVRWGVHGEYLIDEGGRTLALRQILDGLLPVLEPLAVRLGCLDELRAAGALAESGPSADRQRAVYQRSRSLGAVVEALVHELRHDEQLVEP